MICAIHSGWNKHSNVLGYELVSAGKLSSLLQIQAVPTFSVTTGTISSLPLPTHSHHKNYRFTPSSTSLSPKNYPFTPSSVSLSPKNYRLTPSSTSLAPKNYRFTPSFASLLQELSAHSLFHLTLTTRTVGSLPLPPHCHH